jgi:hypothetical protein
MMHSWLAPADLVFELRSAWRRLASIQHAYPNSFLQEVTQWLHRVVLMLRSESKLALTIVVC